MYLSPLAHQASSNSHFLRAKRPVAVLNVRCGHRFLVFADAVLARSMLLYAVDIV